MRWLPKQHANARKCTQTQTCANARAQTHVRKRTHARYCTHANTRTKCTHACKRTGKDVNKGANLNDPVSNIIEKFKKHPSIVSINQKKLMPNSFSFNFVPENAVTNVINNIDSSKAYKKDNIPPSILKANVDIVLHNDINLNIEMGAFQ